MLFVYSVHWWYDGKTTTSSGIIYGEDMTDATKQLTTAFYQDVEEVHLYTIEGGDSGYLSLNVLNSFLEENPLKDED